MLQTPAPDVPILAPNLQFKAHEDAIGSVGFHPLRPLLLSVSGSRHFDAASADDSDNDSTSEDESGLVHMKLPRQVSFPFSKDNSAKLWDFTAEPVPS